MTASWPSMAVEAVCVTMHYSIRRLPDPNNCWRMASRRRTWAALAASLAYGLARNHPFVDGNKRTAAVACETFIVLNGATLQAGDLELYGFYIGLADGSLDEAACAAWLRPRLQSRHQQRVHESAPNYG